MSWFIQIIPVVAISLPFYFFDLYLKRKIMPEKGIKKFLLYLLVMLPAAYLYFIVVFYIFINLVKLKH